MSSQHRHRLMFAIISWMKRMKTFSWKILLRGVERKTEEMPLNSMSWVIHHSLHSSAHSLTSLELFTCTRLLSTRRLNFSRKCFLMSNATADCRRMFREENKNVEVRLVWVFTRNLILAYKARNIKSKKSRKIFFSSFAFLGYQKLNLPPVALPYLVKSIM